MSNALYDQEDEIRPEVERTVRAAKQSIDVLVKSARSNYRDKQKLEKIRTEIKQYASMDFSCPTYWVDDERNDHYQTSTFSDETRDLDQYAETALNAMGQIGSDDYVPTFGIDTRLQVTRRSGCPESELYMEIPYCMIKEMKLSIPEREALNQGSGIIRNKENPVGYRIVKDEQHDSKQLSDVYGADIEEARRYHRTYQEHAADMGLTEQFIVIGNGNLGNNPWYTAWQKEETKKRFALSGEPEDRTYGVLIISGNDTPQITRCIIKEEGIYQSIGGKIGNMIEDVLWATTGIPIILEGKEVPLEDIIEEFYDIRHIFDWIDHGPKKESNIEHLKYVYKAAEELGWKETINFCMGSMPRARFLHSIIGTKEDCLVIAHSYGTIEEIAVDMARQEVENAIILDQGGSCGCYVKGTFYAGEDKDKKRITSGFMNTSSYFRDTRISTIGISLFGKASDANEDSINDEHALIEESITDKKEGNITKRRMVLDIESESDAYGNFGYVLE